jgi:hypothetical protein
MKIIWWACCWLGWVCAIRKVLRILFLVFTAQIQVPNIPNSGIQAKWHFQVEWSC